MKPKPPQSPEVPTPLHLCLSGGGLRATFFHLGALYALAQKGQLQHLTLLSTVSGGSLAAVLFLDEWAQTAGKSGSDPDRLAECVLNAYRRLWDWSGRYPRTRAMTSLRGLTSPILNGEFGFGEAMMRQFKTLIGDRLDQTLDSAVSKILPEWRIATSDYQSGFRVMLVFNDRHQHRTQTALYEKALDIGIAAAIGASTAIPGLFEPLQWGDYQLGDGGILDNQGIRELEDVSASRICIDASAPLCEQLSQSAWSTPIRAIDMLMEQTRTDVISKGIELRSLRNTTVTASTMFDWKSGIAELRTDLDKFTSLECDYTFLAGYQSFAGNNAIPDAGAFKDNSASSALWRFGTSSELLADSISIELQHQVIQHIKDGRYRVLPNWRASSRATLFMNVGQAYMAAMFIFAGLAYANLIFGALTGGGVISWLNFWIGAWILGFFILICSDYTRRDKDKRRVSILMIIRVTLGAPLVPFAWLLGSLSYWGIRNLSSKNSGAHQLTQKIISDMERRSSSTKNKSGNGERLAVAWFVCLIIIVFLSAK